MRQAYKSNGRLGIWQVFAILAIVVFLSHYARISEFGYYEDDLVITDGLSFTWPQIVESFISSLKHFERPIGYVSQVFFPFLVDKIGGIALLHWMGFFIVLLNTWLVYGLVKEEYSQKLAFFSALIFALYPADTTRGLLIHDFHLQQALLYFLVASVLYGRDWRKTSYLCIFAALCTYESAILPFLVIPLMFRVWNVRLLKELAIHLLIMGGMISLYAILRISAGEIRLTGAVLDPFETVRKIFGSLVYGPLFSGYSFVVRPFTALHEIWRASSSLEGLIFLWAIPIGIVSWYGIWRLMRSQINSNAIVAQGGAPAWRSGDLRLALTGSIVVVIAYGLAFVHYPPKDLAGRATSVHLASAIGWSFLGAVAMSRLLKWATARHQGNLFACLFGMYFALLGAFHLSVQNDYLKSWEIQKQFWAAVLELCPDMTENTIIFFDRGNLEETRYVYSFAWSIPVTLEQIYQFPRDWANPPRVFARPERKDMVLQSDSIRWVVPTARWWSHWTSTPREKLMFLSYEDGKWVRKNNMVIDDLAVSVPEKSLVSPQKYPGGVLYRLMFE